MSGAIHPDSTKAILDSTKAILDTAKVVTGSPNAVAHVLREYKVHLLFALAAAIVWGLGDLFIKWLLNRRTSAWGSSAAKTAVISDYPLNTYLADVKELGRLAKNSLLATCKMPPSWFFTDAGSVNRSAKRASLKSLLEVECKDKRRLIILKDLDQVNAEIKNKGADKFERKFGGHHTRYPVTNCWTTSGLLEDFAHKKYMEAASEDLIIIDGTLIFGYRFSKKCCGITTQKKSFLISAEKEFINGIAEVLNDCRPDENRIFASIEALQKALEEES